MSCKPSLGLFPERGRRKKCTTCFVRRAKVAGAGQQKGTEQTD